ncbi:MarR family transcriptional regulator [Roseibium sp.]|uniref:MarR family transcriptional regulator n=1 Tax=Roseibium sp. TaxID=1936156 RepID=UPI00391B00B0
MTEKSLIYHDDLDLRNKHVIIGEAAGSADGNGNAFLRQLLSEGQIRYVTTQSTNDGLKGVTIEVEGPTGLIMTTTAGRIHPEDESRMISVSVSESPDQIRAALIAQAVGSQTPVEEIDLQPWHDLYDVYRSGPKEVTIPYAGKIAEALPTSHDRIKRDFPQVLNLIQAHTVLHSCTRERTKDGAVIATREDYEVVYGLVNAALSEGLEVTVPESVRQVVEAVKEIGKMSRTSTTVSQAEIVRHLRRDRAVISRNVNRAVELGYLKDDTPGQGRTSSLRIGEVELPSNKVLPSPEELFAGE